MTLTRRSILVGLIGLIAPAPLVAQQGIAGIDSAWFNTNVNDSIPVLFTISGGISLGSYQSGVNWALVRFIRIAHDNVVYRRNAHLPDLNFAAMAGASAGNINALMSAVAWCTEKPGQQPDSSIFWKTWINTGWEQLYPDDAHRKQHGGIFDRTYYEVGPLAWLRQQMAHLSYPSDCNIPVGMTMTRVEPTPTTITANVSASTQRYAAIVRVQASPKASRVAFVQPSSLLFHPSLGALASLGVSDADTIAATQVLNTLMASSAFPIAFADVELDYVPGDKIRDGSACAKKEALCGSWVKASFIDGGVFDNNPLALALGLFRLDDSSRVGSKGTRPRIIYINPDALRDPLKRARDQSPARSAEHVAGIASFVKVLGGAVPSARQYELQSMARALVDPTRNTSITPFISTTDRGYPIVSEHLDAFAGFFGKPFREYDYYAGIYDGLHYISEHVLCAEPRRLLRQPGINLETCTQIELATLMRDSTQFGLGPVARAVLHALFVKEYTAPPWLHLAAVSSDSIKTRIYVLTQLVEANAAEFGAHTNCHGGDWLDRLVCSDGIGGVVDRFANDSIIKIVGDWSMRPACTDTLATPDIRAQCLADGTLRELVEDGTRSFAGYRLKDIFQQLHDDRSQGSTTRAAVAMAEYYFRSIDDEYLPRFVADPSTVTPYAKARWHFYPYRVGAVFGASGVGGPEIAYRPSFRIAHALRFIVPFGAIGSRAPNGLSDSSFHFISTPGIGLSYKVGKPWAHELSLDWRWLIPFNDPRSFERRDLSWRFLYQPLGGKLILGYGQMSPNLAGPSGKRNLVTVGLGDVNGLLYYLLRK